MEFLSVDPVGMAEEKLWNCVKNWKIPCKKLSLGELGGKILAENVSAREAVPQFDRSTVDGYAVVAKTTAAAGESIPVFLDCVGEVEMGLSADFSIKEGQCAYVPTGGMIPKGADAVLMVEYSEKFSDEGIACYGAVANGENVVFAGEDIQLGEKLFFKGRRISPQDIGALAALGITSAKVYDKLKIAIISTGDELVPPEKSTKNGEVRDINTYALAALAEKNGFKVVKTLIVKDDKKAQKEAASSAMKNCDLVIISGGSSQGKKDTTRVVIDEVASPGVFTHGLAIKPGKPTILGYDEKSKTLMVGLPGHPVSAMMVFETLICKIYYKLTNSEPKLPINAELSCNIHSSPGKLTCTPVAVHWENGRYMAVPIFGKSGLITTLTASNGYFETEENCEGILQGETVRVHLF